MEGKKEGTTKPDKMIGRKLFPSRKQNQQISDASTEDTGKESRERILLKPTSILVLSITINMTK
jgi:hypothetical protein